MMGFGLSFLPVGGGTILSVAQIADRSISSNRGPNYRPFLSNIALWLLARVSHSFSVPQYGDGCSGIA
jgi:hypothetical protein